MFKLISKTLLTGFITLLPIVLTIYLLYWLATTSEYVMGSALRYVLPQATYFPGLGMIVGLVIVFIVGLLMNAYLVRRLFAFGEQIVFKLPLIKTVYRAMRDLFDFFSPKKDAYDQVVTVNIGGIEMIGFITQQDPSRMPESFRGRDSVLVYLPMSYMIGGYTALIPRKDITPCKMSMEEAMRFVLTAGITGKQAS
jgi:uncharacterized membrane protein